MGLNHPLHFRQALTQGRHAHRAQRQPYRMGHMGRSCKGLRGRHRDLLTRQRRNNLVRPGVL